MSLFAWDEITSSARSNKRHRHTSVKLNNKMFILGGYHEDGPLGVCSSTDGLNWGYNIQEPGWNPYRFYHSSISANNRMWVLGGAAPDVGILNDVWSSIDGSIWINNLATAPWAKRYGHSSVFFNDKLWIIGGRDYVTDYNDVWNSTDGVTWYKVTASAPWDPRAFHGGVVFNGQMWIIGGSTVLGNYYQDIWSSSDGISWENKGSFPLFRNLFSLVSYGGYMVLLGGREPNDVVQNDVWYSADGINWSQDNDASWSAREEHTALVYDNKIWIVNGRDSDGELLSDVWSGEIFDSSSSSSSSSESSYSSQTNLSISLSSQSSESSSLQIETYGVTYLTDMKNVDSINNPLMGEDVGMKYKGFFDVAWDANDMRLEGIGYGLRKTINSRGLIYCDDASKLFSMSEGYLGMIVSLPYGFTNGIYDILRGDNTTFNEYILWGVNVGKYDIGQPGLYAALTSRGIEFTIWTSYALFTTVDSFSNISANTDIFIEFYWNAIGGISIKVNGSVTSVGAVPINVADSLKGLNFCLLDSPFGYSELNCIIRRIIVKNMGN